MKKLLIALLLLSSCAITRRNTSLTTVVKDSCSIVKTDSVSSLQTHYKTIESTDTTIGVPRRSVTVIYNYDDLQPLYNSKGKAVDHSFAKDSAGMHIAVTVLADGGVKIVATADSLTTVIKGLKREKDSVAALVNHTGLNSQKRLSSQVTEEKSITVKTRGFLAAYWPYLAGVLVLAFIVYFLRLHWPLSIIKKTLNNGRKEN